MRKGAGRAFGVVGLVTLGVSVLGYVREATLAARFGTTPDMDAYVGAVLVPNLIYFVLVTGTVAPAFVPVMLRHSDPRARSESFSAVTTFVLLLVALLVTLAMGTASVWLPAVFSGFDTPTADEAVRLTRIVLPAIPLLAVSGVLAATLQGFQRYVVAAGAPALSSTAVIVAVLWADGDDAVYFVAVATAVGLALQALILIPGMRGLGIRFRPTLRLNHADVRKVVRLGAPICAYIALANVVQLLEQGYASRISAGVVSTLTYASRLFVAPSNLLAAPLAVIAFTHFAREAALPERGQLSAQLSRTLRLVVFLFLPISIWTSISALEVVRVVFERAQFSFADSLATSRVLAIYALAILPNAMAIVMLRCLFAVEDTVTPLLAELANCALFVGAASLLSGPLGVTGLAISRSSTYFLMAAVLAWVLSRRKGLLRGHWLGSRFLWGVVAATTVMAAVALGGALLLSPLFNSGSLLSRLTALFLLLTLSASSYLAVARALGIAEAAEAVETATSLISWTRARE